MIRIGSARVKLPTFAAALRRAGGHALLSSPMCGIAGYFARDGIAEGEGRALLERMAAAILHRGPDGTGFRAEPHAGIASTRLAIIDLAGGAMPLGNEDDRISVVFNGEIYDHPTHRKVLEGRGHRFKTRADSEVLVHLYEEHGPDLTGLLTGMFAFAIWDSTRQRLLLARDRFGIKPLFFAESGGLLLFASEIKALLASERIERRLDMAAVRDLASCGYPMPPRTLFEGVRALLPGHRMVLDRAASPKIERWYTPSAGLAPRGDRAAETLRALLDTVVREHLLADVEVGSYLSGGLDSVSIAALAATATGKLHTFSMVFPDSDPGFDESEHSNLAAKAIKSEHHPIPQGPIEYSDYAGTIRAMESPQVHTVAFCLYRLSRAVREAGLKVVLSGEGADEVFGGYGVFKLSQMRRSLLGRVRLLRRLAAGLFLNRRQPDLYRALRRWWSFEPAVRARYGLVPPWVEQWWILAEAWRKLLSPELRAALPDGLDALPEPPAGLALEGVQAGLQRDLAFEQASRLDGWVLTLGDRLSMAHSVELRVPFLDHRVVELAAAAPARQLLRGFREKVLLRQAMSGRIPEQLRARTKRAFIAPMKGWLFSDRAPDYARELLSPASLAAGGRFDPVAIDRARKVLAGPASGLAVLEASWSLHLALGVEVFCKSFGV